VPFLNLFAGKFRKRTYCPYCKQQSKETLFHKLTALDLEELDFIGYELQNESFLTSHETFRCGCRVDKQDYQRSVLTIEKFPEVVVIAIHQETLLNRSKPVKLIPKIKLKASGMKNFPEKSYRIIGEKIGQGYDYCGGILTKYKDVDGGDSIAVIQCGGNQGSYYKFADDSVEIIQLDDSTGYHPKLLFYCKSGLKDQ